MFEVNATITGFSRIDFDRKKIRKALRAEGRKIQKEARSLVARRVISNPGEFPGKSSGQLARSIQVKLSRPGFLVKIAPFNKSNSMKDFYPAFLFYGVKNHGSVKPLLPGKGVGKSNRRRRGERASLMASRSANDNYVVKPRENYMAEALSRRREASRAAILNALQDSLIPRK